MEFLLLKLYYISKAESEEMLPDINTVGPSSLGVTRSESPELIGKKVF